MNAIFKNYVSPALAAIFVAALLLFFRTGSAKKLWRGYTVLSVPASASKTQVLEVLEGFGCGQVIFLEGQRSDEFFLPAFLFESDSSYENGKIPYFFDSEKTVSLYYVPDQKKSALLRAAKSLKKDCGISCSIDCSGDFPVLIPIVPLLVFLAFALAAENKAVFFASGVFPLAFAFCNPLYSSSAASCLGLCGFYLTQKVWRRRGGTNFLLKNPYIWLFAFFSILCSFLAGFVRGTLFLLSVVASASLLFILLNLQELHEKRFSFAPVFIRDAKAAGGLTIRSAKNILASSCGSFALLVLFLSGANFSFGKAQKPLSFPAPKEYNEEDAEFSNLEDFYERKWNAAAFQFRPLGGDFRSDSDQDVEAGVGRNFGENQNPQNPRKKNRPKEGDKISRLRYEKSGGKIFEREETLFVFGSEFKKNAAREIETLSYGAIEKLWLSQGRKFSVRYAQPKSLSEEGGAAVAAALFAAMLLPLFAAFNFARKLKRDARP